MTAFTLLLPKIAFTDRKPGSSRAARRRPALHIVARRYTMTHAPVARSVSSRAASARLVSGVMSTPPSRCPKPSIRRLTETPRCCARSTRREALNRIGRTRCRRSTGTETRRAVESWPGERSHSPYGPRVNAERTQWARVDASRVRGGSRRDVEVDPRDIRRRVGTRQPVQRLRDVLHPKRHRVADRVRRRQVDRILELTGRHHIDANTPTAVGRRQRSRQHKEPVLLTK